MSLRPAVAVACLVLATSLGAQEHPQTNRGFDPDTVYQFGEVDHVDLRGGKVAITLPIGPSYPVSERLRYQLTLAYSSAAWDFVQQVPSNLVRSKPNRLSNSGWGWALHMGRLLDPADPLVEGTRWIYESGDSGQHEFWTTLHTCEGPPPNGCGTDGDTTNAYDYSRDGSFIRLHHDPAGFKEIEMSDGTVHRFDPVPGSPSWDWRLTQIRDRYGSPSNPTNWVRIDYTSEPNTWVITDKHSDVNAGIRVHRIRFASRAYDGASVPMIDAVELAAFNGAVAEYDFRYYGETGLGEPAETIQRRDLRHTDGHPDLPINEFTAARLSGVVLPDGTRWTMRYHEPGPAVDGPRGQIREIWYPTGGRIHYTYGRWEMPGAEPCPADDFIGNLDLMLFERILDEPGDGPTGDPRWTYTYETSRYNGSSPAPCPNDFNWPREQLTVRVITPLLDQSEYFYSIWSHRQTSPLVGGLGGFDRFEFGLPFTRGHVDTPDSAPVAGRYLSSKTFDCNETGSGCVEKRREYVAYESDGDPGSVFDLAQALQSHRRVSARRTVYLDDPQGGGVFTFGDVQHSEYEGVGHYRKSETTGNFAAGGGGASDSQTSFTNYNPGRQRWGIDYVPFPVTSNWILGTYDRADVMGGSETNDDSRKYFEFNANTGFLNCVRTLKNGAASLTPGPGANNRDLIVQFTDAAGNVDQERHYGGDKPQGGNWLPVSTSCSNVGSRAPDYTIDHGQSYGVRNLTAYLPAPAAFKSLDLDIDRSTGLPRISRDTAVVPTTFSYDLLGRLTRITPGSTSEVAAEAWTDIDLTDVSPPLSARIYRCSAGTACTGDNRLTSAIHEYDGFGRTAIERRKFRQPVGSEVGWNERFTTYDAMGHRTAITGWQLEGSTSHWTTFDDYDAFGRPASTTLADGHQTDFEYLGVRWSGTETDVGLGLGGGEQCAVHWEGFDRQGRLWKVEEDQPCTGSAQSRTVYSYDESGRMTKVCQKDGSGSGCDQSRLFAYDNRGFLTSETHPEKGANGNGAVSYTAYDARGHALSRQEVSPSRVLDYAFDFAERLLTIKNGSTIWKEYTYDDAVGAGEGKVATTFRLNRPGGPWGGTTDIGVEETYLYEEVGGRASRRETQVTVDEALGELWVTEFEFDGLGNSKRTKYPRCTGSSCADGSATPERLGVNAYSQGLLTAVNHAGSSWATLTYHPNLLVNVVTHGNGMTETIANDPNDLQRPLSITVQSPEGRWPPSGTNNYLYDGAGNILRIGSATTGDLFQYDRLSRLVKGKLQTIAPVPEQTYGLPPEKWTLR